MKQVAITRIYAQENNKKDCAENAKAELLWDENHFDTLNMDALSLPLVVFSPEEVCRRKSWVFCAWIEKWEKSRVLEIIPWAMPQ